MVNHILHPLGDRLLCAPLHSDASAPYCSTSPELASCPACIELNKTERASYKAAFIYRLHYSLEDEAWIASIEGYPSLSFLHEDPISALNSLVILAHEENLPPPRAVLNGEAALERFSQFLDSRYSESDVLSVKKLKELLNSAQKGLRS